MTLQTLRAQVRAILDQPSDGSNVNDLLPDATITAALNRALQKLAQLLWDERQRPLVTRVDTIPFVDGQAAYNLAADVMSLWPLSYTSGERNGAVIMDATTLLPRAYVAEMDEESSVWRQAGPGTPTCWYDPDDDMGQRIAFYPPPDTSSVTSVKVQSVVMPDAMAADTDVPAGVRADRQEILAYLAVLELGTQGVLASDPVAKMAVEAAGAEVGRLLARW